MTGPVPVAYAKTETPRPVRGPALPVGRRRWTRPRRVETLTMTDGEPSTMTTALRRPKLDRSDDLGLR
ncbi:unnamed protein product [Heligmosomoides polygyrus]|uniref:Protein of unassigned function n=1 Tax=Heligmosomoides polygyrus TaxID=6339 RepID=A0A183GDA2_HELPZ|nr:unnamed protein product [Heligmosomoides polygyrus]